MRFVKEQHEFGFVRVARFRQVFKQFRQKPEHERAIQARRAHEFFRVQDVDDALPVFRLNPIEQIQFRFAEKLRRAFAFQLQQLALDGADAGGGHVAVGGAVFFGVVGHILQQRTEVFQINQMPAVVVRHFEYEVEHAFLRVVQVHQPCQQHGAHRRNADAHGNAGAAVHIPKAHGKALQVIVGQAVLLHPFGDFAAVMPGAANAGQIAFHVGHEHGDARLAETFGEFAQGYGFARAGRAGDEAVAVGHFGDEFDGAVLMVVCNQVLCHCLFAFGCGCRLLLNASKAACTW